MNINIGSIDWEQILAVVGAAYLTLSALAGFFQALSSGFATVWPSGAKFCATVAAICGTIAGALHTIPGSFRGARDGAVKALPFILVGLSLGSTACLAGSFEEARGTGTRAPVMAMTAGVETTVAAAPSEYCASLDNGQLWFRAIGTGLALAAGPTVIPAFAMPEDNAETKRAFLVAAGLAGVTGGVLLLIGDGKATTWIRDCGDSKVGVK